MGIILGTALCLTMGYLVVAFFWPQGGNSSLEPLLKLCLAIGFGLGTFSVLFVVERLLGISRIAATDLCVASALFVLYLLLRNRTVPFQPITEIPDFHFPHLTNLVLKTSFALAMVAALYAAVCRTLAYAHGEGWDAFAIWNLHARFLFLGGSHWRDGFAALIPWSHPDYPLLVPGATAHLWAYLGRDRTAVPAGIGLAFTLSTIGLLISSLRILRGWNSAMLGGITLASTPLFIQQGTSQYVDVPLSFFMLASIALLHMAQQRSTDSHKPRSFVILTGLAAGFAAWTKNEGLLFLIAIVTAQVVTTIARRRTKSDVSEKVALATLLLAVTPVLLFIAWFKHSIVPRGDLFSNSADVAHKLLVPARYWIVLQWYAKEFFRFGSWWIVPGTVALLIFYLLSLKPDVRRNDRTLQCSVFTLGLTLAGYFAIYVITPRDIYWHLRFSLNRLFLQLWPSVIFLFFLFLFGGRQESASTSKSVEISENRSNC